VFSRARNERFGDSAIFRSVFERVVSACIAAGLVGGKGFAVDASLIEADANKHRSIPGAQWNKDIDPEPARRAVKEYLATLDDPAYGTASDVTPKFVSPSDPAAQWTGALRNAAFFAYADNYLIDVKFGIIMDVEASRAIRQAEVGASQTMIERTEACFGIKPGWLAGDTAYGSAANLDWLVNQQGIAPMYQSSTSPSARTARSHVRSSSTTRRATSIYAQRARRWPRRAMSALITRSSISVPCLSVAPARSKRSVARTCQRDGSNAT
jgi:hypothetical protein